MKEDKFFFNLFANNILEKRANKCIIYDLVLNRTKLIPVLLYEILISAQKHSIKEIKSIYNNELDDGIDTYLNFLEKDNWGIFTNDLEQYPKLNLEYNTPNLISHAVLELSSILIQKELFRKTISELTSLSCENLSILIVNSCEVDEIQFIAEEITKTPFSFVVIKCMFNNSDTNYQKWNKKILFILRKNRRIKRIEVYNSPFEQSFDFEDNKLGEIIYKQKDLHSCSISEPYSFINQMFFIEAKNRNSCLNGKICIDRNGNIKNCLEMKNVYGNIFQNSLHSIITNSDFCEMWKITKDEIMVCQDCLYRYQCQDCRAYLENPEDIYSKPSFCNYNPYES